MVTWNEPSTTFLKVRYLHLPLRLLLIAHYLINCAGNVSQFSDVKKKAKDRSRSKAKETPVDSGARPPRGRGAVDGARGGRGRPERGRGVSRAGRGGSQQTSAPRAGDSTSVPTNESSAWGSTAAAADGDAWGSSGAPATEKVPTAEAPKPTVAAPAGPPKKTWASMFAQPKAPPAIPKPAAQVAPPTEPSAVPSSDISSGYVEVTHSDIDTESTPQTSQVDDGPVLDTPQAERPPVVAAEEPIVDIPPSKDKLTEDNVEHLPDVSQPAPEGTAASTVESSRGPDSTSISVVAQPQAPIGRPAVGGFATTALKATTPSGRSASFQRKILDQQEAVVMPGNHAVDRTAVQFGSLGLDGDADDLDVDDEREEAETRAQPPQHSPTAQPRAALPPAPRQEVPTQEASQTKPAPGLPPVGQQPANASPLGSQAIGQQSQAQSYNQFGRYGQPAETAAQKLYDPFGQPASQPSPFEGYGSQSQAPSSSQQPATSQLGGFSSAANDYSSYYTADQQRAGYGNYYGGYGQQSSNQEAGAAQQRTGSAFGAGANDSAFPSAQSQQVSKNPLSIMTLSSVRIGEETRCFVPCAGYLHNIVDHRSNTSSQQSQSRFGENQQSGHNTPSQSATAQHGAQAQQPVHQQGQGQAQGQGQGQHGGFPYSHPYYNQPYYHSYMAQYNQYGNQGYGPFGGKGGMYGQPHHGYGAPQTSYDQHASSPAHAGSFGREGGLSGGIGSDYSRSGSAQPSQAQQHSSTGGYGNDVFGRSPGSFASQSQQYSQQGAGQQSSTEDSLKPFGDKSSTSQASGGLAQQPGRPTSATNNSSQGAQSGLPPPQSHQGFGGYPSQYGQHQGGQSSQYGGLGGLGGHQGGAQSHQNQAYGAYGAGFGNNYQSYGGRGGWGGNYGH